mgnify:CR=1 FL=1
MSEINSLNSASYYAGIQNASSEVKREQKKENVKKSSRLKFTELIKSSENSDNSISLKGFPSEIKNMSVEQAAIYLKDQIDLSGNVLCVDPSQKNLDDFKEKVQQFIRYLVLNNFEITKKTRRGFASPLNAFSNYNTQKRPKDPRTNIVLINESLDKLARGMLIGQKNNLKLLEQVNQIKGLIVDLMQA